ncbi:MAG: P63C domain-containing protein [Leifsonia sp.]
MDDQTEEALFRLDSSEGGKARARALTPERREEIARRAAEARWAKNVHEARYAGKLIIGDREIECAVIDDGTRILSQGTVLAALGRAKSMGRRQAGSEAAKRAPFVSANNLEAFVGDELSEMLEPVNYRLPGSRFISVGYRAEALPLICDVYLEARKQGKLLRSQEPAAAASEVLMRSLARVGIVALVDEATGYQEVRARDELQRLLEKYVQEAFRPWVQVFPHEFFREIYRLYGWEYKPGKSKHPQYVGKIINQYVYEQLPDGVLEELQTLNPRLPSGGRARKHHQYLTVDTGNVHLDRQILTVTTLMQVADDLDDFKALFEKRFPGAPRPRALRVSISDDDEVQTLFELDPSGEMLE